MKINCPYCFPSIENTLGLLPSDHKDFYLTTRLNDGTKKFFYCSNCHGAFCYDKMQNNWQLTPSTYDDFLASGKIKDMLYG